MPKTAKKIITTKAEWGYSLMKRETQGVSTEKMRKFLLRRGWTQHPFANERLWRFTNEDNYEVVLAASDIYLDALPKVLAAIELIAILSNTPFATILKKVIRS